MQIRNNQSINFVAEADAFYLQQVQEIVLTRDIGAKPSCQHRLTKIIRLYRNRSTSKQSETVKPTTRFICSLTIKETNFVLILVIQSLQFSEVAATTTIMTDLSRHEYDWRL